MSEPTLKPFTGKLDDNTNSKQQPALKPFTGALDGEDKGFLGQAKDHAVSFLGKGTVGVGEVAVGLSDMMSDGATGKILSEKLGYDPKAAKNVMTGWQSEQYQQQLKDSANIGNRKIEEGDDFATKVGKKFDNAVDITKNAISNPSLITNTVAESLPSMFLGGVLGRASGIANPVVAGAVGEGAVMAGSQAEQIRQETVDGRLTADQSLASVGTGALGGLFGYAGGRLAQKMGLSDVDTAMQTGRLTTQQVGEEIAKTPMRAIPTAVIKGAISEGFLEELPQSVSEQILQNLALDKPWHDGVENAAVMGALAGMAMGGTVSGVGKTGDWWNSRSDTGSQDNQQQSGSPNLPSAPSQFGSNPDSALTGEYIPRGNVPQGDNQGRTAFVYDQPSMDADNLLNNNGFDNTATSDAPVNPNDPDTPPAPNGNYFDNDYGSDAAFDDLLNAVPPTGQTPSQQMGIDPNAGPMSSAAALAVDSGASPVAQLGYTPTQQTQEQSNTPISDALPSDYRQLLESQNGKQPFSTGLENAGESTSQQYDANAIARQTETNDAATDQTETIQPILGADGQNKWFGSQDKAQAFIDKKNLGNDYQVVQDGKRFEIQPKQVAQNDNLNNQNTTPDIENNIEKSQEIADLEQQFANEKSVPKKAQIRKQITELQNGLVSDQSQGDVPNPYDENNLRANVRHLSLQASKEAQAQNAEDSNYIADLGSTASARSNEKVKQQFPELYKRAEELAKTAEIRSAGRRGNTRFSSLSFKGDPSFVSGDSWTKRPTSDEILQQAIWHLSQDDKNSAPDDVPPNNELQNADIKNLADSTQETAPPNAAPNIEDLVSVTTNDGETYMVLASELNDSNVKNLTKFSAQGKRVAVKLPRGRIASTSEQSKQPQQHAWDQLSVDEKTAVLQKAGWKTSAGGLNVIGKKLAGQTSKQITPETLKTIERFMGNDASQNVKKSGDKAVKGDRILGRNGHTYQLTDVEYNNQGGVDSATVRLVERRDGQAIDGVDSKRTLADFSKTFGDIDLTQQNEAPKQAEQPKVEANEQRESKIQSWINEWSQLKENGTASELDNFHKKVKIALNGFAQKKGVVAEFEQLKVDIENFAKDYNKLPKTEQSTNTDPSAAETSTEQITAEIDSEATKTEATQKPKAEVSENRLVSDDRAAELRARLKAKLSQLNSGIDPEILAIGAELAVYHIERGARKFSAFAKNIANDLGVSVDKIRPYLRSWYNGARDMMEDMGADIQGMDSADTVRAELKKLDNSQQSDGEVNQTESHLQEDEVTNVEPSQKLKEMMERSKQRVHSSKQIIVDEHNFLNIGSSILTGQPVYTLWNDRGNYFTVDVDSIKPNATFNQVVIDKARAVKKQEEQRDAELVKKYPNGVFSGTDTQVVTTENVPKKVKEYLGSLLNMLGMDTKVFLATSQDINAQGAQEKYHIYGGHRSILSTQVNAEENGATRLISINQSDFNDAYIALNSGMSEETMIEVIAHELGHLIEKTLLKNASKETLDAIKADFQQWLASVKGVSKREHLALMRNRHIAQMNMQDKASIMDTSNANLSPYWFSFSEWFADQVSRWTTTSEKPLSLVEKFFSSVAKKLKQLAQIVKNTKESYQPSVSVRDYLDGIARADFLEELYPQQSDGESFTELPNGLTEELGDSVAY
ncbi:MAG: hypothetical protein RSB22_14135, partial [Acinetobacter sp.]